MKHENDHLRFPTGHTVEFLRKKAKKLVKQSKDTDQPIKLAAALDIVAKENGFAGGWAVAMEVLGKEVA